MIKQYIFLISECVLASVSLIGFVIFLKFVKKKESLASRALNVLMCYLTILYIVFSISMLIVDLLFVLIWNGNFPGNIGNISVQIFIFLVNTRNTIFLAITIATMIKILNQPLYLKWSLEFPWIIFSGKI